MYLVLKLVSYRQEHLGYELRENTPKQKVCCFGDWFNYRQNEGNGFAEKKQFHRWVFFEILSCFSQVA